MFKQLKKYLQSDQSTSPASVCPNCWGRQEYQGQFKEAIQKEEITLNNIDQKKGWIDAYAAKNLHGIRLEKKGNKIVCPSCKLSI